MDQFLGEAAFVRVGDDVINLAAVTKVRRKEDGAIFVHLAGGEWVACRGDSAAALWHLLERVAVPLRSE